MQRSDEKEPSTTEFSLDSVTDESSATSSNSATSNESRLAGLFSPKLFVVVFLASLLGAFLGGSIPIVGFIGRFLGLFAVGFGAGLLSGRSHYAEVGLGGALAFGLLWVLTTLTSGFAFAPFAVELLAKYGLAIAGAGAGVGLLTTVIGHYFGRDLRDGLTRDI
ncbi:hypothetical protein GL213_04510 [Halogeometricum borinquense]|uniref:DUF5518 domain-containing protein n=1 Tax=Halogeometricum borinquense TaxID=60847 RepID=A0A6C0UIC4_9EURY|nr:hypothetical protein [Halogeometricum borinquense]QIB75175.1 hypothetical protein G3I44_13310 [Halogeometricum borinquense]QIQ75844.1 hypothetical protein GL213_04510 [Halogeometricum borinquense]